MTVVRDHYSDVNPLIAVLRCFWLSARAAPDPGVNGVAGLAGESERVSGVIVICSRFARLRRGGINDTFVMLPSQIRLAR